VRLLALGLALIAAQTCCATAASERTERPAMTLRVLDACGAPHVATATPALTLTLGGRTAYGYAVAVDGTRTAVDAVMVGERPTRPTLRRATCAAAREELDRRTWREGRTVCDSAMSARRWTLLAQAYGTAKPPVWGCA
jgi:phosphate-selective porin